MKKSLLIVAALVAVSFASCKKDRVCECTDSDTAPGYTAGPASKTTLVKVSKGTAKANCFTTKQDYTAGGTTYTHTSTCSLK